MRVRSICGDRIVTVRPADSLAAAAGLMLSRGVASLAVVGSGELQGIITERDLLRAVWDRAIPHVARVSAYMTPDPVTAGPDDEMTAVAERMAQLGIRHVPVIDGERIRGMLSVRDFLMLELWPRVSLPHLPPIAEPLDH